MGDVNYGVVNSEQYNAVKVLDAVDTTRENIMSEIRNKLVSGSDGGIKTNQSMVIHALGDIDITQSAGAMVTDDTMQRLSTTGQTVAQIEANRNRVTKEVSSALQR